LNIIDCHNHSLPNIDDGAIDMAMAISMLKIAETAGTTDIALTPHHLNGAFTNFANQVARDTKILQEHAIKNGLKVKLHLGSEVHLVPETAEHLVSNKALTYGGHGKAALIELPKSSIPTGVESILSELIFNGITPVIAHPERNSSLRKDMTPLKEWTEFGCKTQITGQSCTGDFGQSLQDLSFDMITKNLVHLVASDAHRPEGRNPDLRKAATILNNVFGEDARNTLLHDNPLRLLTGQKLVTLDIDIDSVNLNTKKATNKKKSTNKKKVSWLTRLKSFK